MTPVSPGDVLVVRSAGAAGTFIRFGAALRDQPNLDNHVAVVHHVTGGVTWCVEGRPGIVGWRDAADYLRSRWTVTNVAEPKTASQRGVVCQALMAAIGTPYDWEGIALDAATAVHLPELFAEKWDGRVPGHVVCSSLAAWAYMKAGLPHPPYDDVPRTTPGDWGQFILTRGWTVP